MRNEGRAELPRFANKFAPTAQQNAADRRGCARLLLWAGAMTDYAAAQLILLRGFHRHAQW
ncbi:hypothetical protein D3879_01040 [Pseudomonas cavernicola]|uniref:Uncharacterized protein n=1 Tax=Pseudomonas cavernicola TaxID=2320866 RepID=A0A418XHM5_9PSED|nr:hypothetical protein D3879_01040 [Pseudomonas cavernicola]